MRYIGEPLTVNDAKIGFERSLKLIQMKKPYFLTWTVINKNTEQPIGLLTLIISKPTNTSPKSALSVVQPPEIGIVLSQQSQGRSLSTEALGALIEYGFKQLMLPHINIRFCCEDLAIKHLVKKLGFQFQPKKRIIKIFVAHTDNRTGGKLSSQRFYKIIYSNND
jgi:RimJ/RimL family protein N-acetyltransferase